MNSSRSFWLLIALLVCTLGAFPGTALANGKDVRDDCIQDGFLDKTYTPAEYREALEETSSNEDEYGGDCRNLIEAALNQALSASSGGPGGGSRNGRPGGSGRTGTPVSGSVPGGSSGSGSNSAPGLSGGPGDAAGPTYDSLPDSDEEAADLADATRSGPRSKNRRLPRLNSRGEYILPPDAPPLATVALNTLPLAEKLKLAALALLLVTALALLSGRHLRAMHRSLMRRRETIPGTRS